MVCEASRNRKFGQALPPRAAIPFLLRGLTDSNRLVRLRAAEGLLELKVDLVPIFEEVIALRDQYGLHAFLTALENAGLESSLVASIKDSSREAKGILLEVLRTAKLPAEPHRLAENTRAMAASQS